VNRFFLKGRNRMRSRMLVGYSDWIEYIPLTTFLQEDESILGERSLLIESEAGDHEKLVENPLAQAQDLQDAFPILSTPQTVARQTALGEYLVAHAEESAQAEKRWKDASVDEWKAGAQGKLIRGTIYAIV
jgi:hypothetical protein